MTVGDSSKAPTNATQQLIVEVQRGLHDMAKTYHPTIHMATFSQWAAMSAAPGSKTGDFFGQVDTKREGRRFSAARSNSRLFMVRTGADMPGHVPRPRHFYFAQTREPMATASIRRFDAHPIEHRVLVGNPGFEGYVAVTHIYGNGRG